MKRILILAGIAVQVALGAFFMSNVGDENELTATACSWCGGCYADVDPDCC